MQRICFVWQGKKSRLEPVFLRDGGMFFEDAEGRDERVLYLA